MKVLMLCNKSPYPAVEGGPLAMDAMIRGLLEAGCTVEVLAAESPKYPAANPPEALRQHAGFGFQTARVDLRLRPLPALWNLLRRRSYHSARFSSPDFANALKQLLSRQSFDIIQFETPFLGHYLPFIRKHSKAKLVLRAHNIEQRIWQRLAQREANAVKRMYLKDLSRLLSRFEKQIALSCDGVATITAQDARWFESIGVKQVKSFPFGISFPDEALPPPDLNNEFFHLGSMDWLPNQEGIQWFLKEVWPLAMAQKPDIRLFLAGRNMPEEMLRLEIPGVEIQGEVEEARQFMQRHGILVVPLRSGSGMRIKIIEGMMQGRAIVSTRIGAEGIDALDETHLLLGDTPAEFAARMLQLSNDTEKRNQLGRQARIFVREHFDRGEIGLRMRTFYSALCGAKE